MLIKRIIFYLKTRSSFKSKIIYAIGSFFYVLFLYSFPYLSNKFKEIRLFSKMGDGKKYFCSVRDIDTLYDLYGLEMEEIFKIKEGDIVFDIGAHIGVYGIMISNIAKQIYAFEPYSKNFKSLIRNIKLNKITNIIPLNLALSKQNSYQNLYSFDVSNSMSSLVLSKELSNLNLTTEKTKVVRLDDFVKGLPIKKLDVIKIDTEGSEIDILDGGMRTIKKFKPLLVIDGHCWVYSYDELKLKLKQLNYEIIKEESHPINLECKIVIAIEKSRLKEYKN